MHPQTHTSCRLYKFDPEGHHQMRHAFIVEMPEIRFGGRALFAIGCLQLLLYMHLYKSVCVVWLVCSIAMLG